jgi:hypothetical protein
MGSLTHPGLPGRSSQAAGKTSPRRPRDRRGRLAWAASRSQDHSHHEDKVAVNTLIQGVDDLRQYRRQRSRRHPVHQPPVRARRGASGAGRQSSRSFRRPNDDARARSIVSDGPGWACDAPYRRRSKSTGFRPPAAREGAPGLGPILGHPHAGSIQRRSPRPIPIASVDGSSTCMTRCDHRCSPSPDSWRTSDGAVTAVRAPHPHNRQHRHRYRRRTATAEEVSSPARGCMTGSGQGTESQTWRQLRHPGRCRETCPRSQTACPSASTG